jgi:hypothetical protein
MVMGMGIWDDAAVVAITTVGTEAADIIMDGPGADIADGINYIAYIKAASITGAALNLPSHGLQRVRLASSITLRCTEFGCCSFPQS